MGVAPSKKMLVGAQKQYAVALRDANGMFLLGFAAKMGNSYTGS